MAGPVRWMERRRIVDIRFLGTAIAVDFIVVPMVAFGPSRFVAGDRALLLGAPLVLLTPCVDYVIVFTGLAGGARERLLAATPLLMLLQIVLLPIYLLLFAGPNTVSMIEIEPFLEAFLVLIVIPLLAAVTVQWVGRRHRFGRAIEAVLQVITVPLMMATLAVVIGSQIAAVSMRIASLLLVVPLYIAFPVIMVVVGLSASRLARLDVPATRALVFSGSTRNSLVVLPLALALAESLSVAALAVVTQTVVELVVMVILVRLVPRLTGQRRAADKIAHR
ncbi:arsenic resistance protein [Cryobacterium sandaracinum]|uniref:Arsenic resistance protein n=2 Tax=Cryobacterium sandaracinum TaxID=1259247 RepID=A0ABY2JIY3_9MICO|nr:arsenic resistance protein [Cryobacterium sandaracinum]